MSDGRISRVRVTFTVILAIIFAVLPLPEPLNAARPDLLLLLVIYWSLSAPRIAGLLFAWFCGLAIDVLKGIVLGQHALAFLVVAYFTHKFQLRIRIFPLSQQTLTVFAFLALYQFIVFWLDGIIGSAGHDLDALAAGDQRRDSVAHPGRRSGYLEPAEPLAPAPSFS